MSGQGEWGHCDCMDNIMTTPPAPAQPRQPLWSALYKQCSSEEKQNRNCSLSRLIEIINKMDCFGVKLLYCCIK